MHAPLKVGRDHSFLCTLLLTMHPIASSPSLFRLHNLTLHRFLSFAQLPNRRGPLPYCGRSRIALLLFIEIAPKVDCREAHETPYHADGTVHAHEHQR